MLQLFEDWDGNDWLYVWKLTYNYSEDGHILSELEEIWSVNRWVENWRTQYQYDENGNKTLELEEERKMQIG